MTDRFRGLAVFGIALAVRGIVLADARDAPFWRVPLVDEAAYIELAHGVLQHTPLPHGAWYVAPGYAWFLSLVFGAGGGLVAAKLANLLAGSLCAWLVWHLSRRVAGRGAALAAGSSGRSIPPRCCKSSWFSSRRSPCCACWPRWRRFPGTGTTRRAWRPNLDGAGSRPASRSGWRRCCAASCGSSP
jgi:hypothetical protein